MNGNGNCGGGGGGGGGGAAADDDNDDEANYYDDKDGTRQISPFPLHIWQYWMLLFGLQTDALTPVHGQNKQLVIATGKS